MDYDEAEDYGSPDCHQQILDELEDINSTLKSKGDFSGWILAAIVIFFVAAWPGSWSDKWTDKLWYSLRYNADIGNINVAKRPSDCDFIHAPVGDKGCEYEKTLTIFGDEERREFVKQAETMEQRREYERLPNSVTVNWKKREE